MKKSEKKENRIALINKIKRSNTKFKTMTPAQKRVRIAKDVLELMEANQIKAESSYGYIPLMYNMELDLNTPKGKIEINTEVIDKNLILKIQDTGIGIKKENLDKIFRKISRLPNAIKVRPNGTGLGLFIVKSIVEAHNGTVQVQSDGVNKGSIFTVKLPLDKN